MATKITTESVQAARRIADRVQESLHPSRSGVVLAVAASHDDLHFVIWAIGKNGRITDHKLDASCTDEARLSAHVSGFVQNHLRSFQA